jgi:two-component system sensor histidine kinase KdpD
LSRIALRSLLSLGGVAIVTLVAHSVIPVNPSTAGFAYLLVVLVVASTWGFFEASLASVAATLTYNFFFLPPVGTFTIADPQNWVALFSFLATALIASRLSAKAERRAREAIERQQDVERLYTFSRAILLIDDGEPFAKQLARQLVEIFEFEAALLYDRRTGEIYRAGPSDFEGLEDQLRDAAAHGVSFSDAAHRRVITAVRLGSEPIASIALQGARMPDSVLQGISNLVAIGLERARAQDLARQIEVARRSEQLRTTLIDAMAHEFKTPLTSIKAATTSLLSESGQSLETKKELLTIADEEADHLRSLIDDSIDMARLDTSSVEVHRELSNLPDIVRDAVASLGTELSDRPLEIHCDEDVPEIPLDRRLVKLAIKQLLDNALKYSPPGTPLEIRVHAGDDKVTVEVADHGAGIPDREQQRIFERFYRSPSVAQQVPGSGLGLSITDSIARAHGGGLTVTSQPGRTTFQLALPVTDQKGEPG